MKHTAEIENGMWIIRDESGKIITRFEVGSPMQDIAEVLKGLDSGKHPANVLFPGIFEE